MIITGCSKWTLYEFGNYEGRSACWQPADLENCIPAFFKNEIMMKGWAGQVSSVRHGCYLENKSQVELLGFEKSASNSTTGSHGQVFAN